MTVQTAHGINANTPNEMTIDAGVLVRNYIYNTALASCDILGATKGGVKVEISQTIYDPQIDGAYAPIVGTERLVDFNVKISGNLITPTTKTFTDALLGSGYTFDATHNHIVPGPLVSADYLTNVALLVTHSSNTALAAGTVFIVKNARGDGKFTFDAKPKVNGEQGFAYEGCVTVSDPQTAPYEVYTPIVSGAVS